MFLCRSPVLIAEYLNGERHWQSLNNMDVDEVCCVFLLEYEQDKIQVGGWIDYYRTHSGAEFMTQKKMTYSDHPSIQGMWHPHVHSDPEIAITEFPSEELNRARNLLPTATDNLIDMFNTKVNIDDEHTEGESEKLEKRKQGE